MIPLTLTNEKINSHGGLNLVGKLLGAFCRLDSLFTEPEGSRSDRISDVNILTAQIGLFCQNRIHYSDIELFRNNQGGSFALSLGLETVPGESTQRTRLEALAANPETMLKLEEANLDLIKAHTPSPLEINNRHYIPNDIDVTPMDNTGSNRENVGRTYKGCDGFAPIMSNIGVEGFLLHQEMRPGTQHCQKGTPQFLKRNIELLDELKLEHPVLIRMDAGNDSADTIKVLRESGHYLLVKRNLRKECKVKWLSTAMAMGSPECPREGKEVYTGSVEHMCPGGEKSTQQPLTCIYRVTKRSIDKKGQRLLIDDIEVETYWTNLGEPPDDVIKLYHDHGTSEQFHSEIKSDMGIERFPSGKFEVNALMLSLGAIAYNALRALDQRAFWEVDKWPPHYRKKGARQTRRRTGSIIQDIILVAGKIVSHAGRKTIKIARGWPWSEVIIAMERKIA